MNFSKIKPMLNRVLIQKVGAPTKSPSGLILTDKTKSLNIGKVIEIGTGKVNAQGQVIKPTLSVGQYVMVPDYGGVKVPKANEKDETEILIFQEDDIIAVVEGDFEKI
jgi:chaperonin GroES